MIRFGSRGSDLALTQSRAFAEELKQSTGEEFEIQVIETRGDKNLHDPLAKIDGKGLFTAELEEALREGRIDAAVHSLKDLPVEDPDGLTLGAIPRRERPNDVLVFRRDARDPEGGTLPLLAGRAIGTSSPRRRSSILTLRADLDVRDIRGNVDTRARKVREDHYAATILAAAGLARLGFLQTPESLGELDRCELPTDLFTPAPGQGALGVQCRSGDERILGLLAAVHDATTAACVRAERDLLFRLGGGCSMPLGALVQPGDPAPRDPSSRENRDESYRMTVSLFSETRPACGVSFELLDPDPTRLAGRAATELLPLLQDPLEGRRVVLLRPGESGSRLDRALGLAGADVETVPVSEILPVRGDVREIHPSELRSIAFTSARAVDRFFELVAARSLDLSRTRFFAAGPATADAVRHRGHPCEAPTEDAGGRALAHFVVQHLSHDDGPVLFPCAQRRHGDFEEHMRAADRAVEPIPVYRTEVLHGVEIPDADYIVFTSPSAVRAYTENRPTHPTGSFLALGPTTADAMSAAGLPVRAVAEAPTAQSLVLTIRGLSQ